MNNKLYIGNISFKIGEDELETEFAQQGAVKSVKIIKDRDTGRSKGFGFVEMETEEAAQGCIETLDGKEVGGRALKVSIAKDREPRSGGGGGRSFNKRPGGGGFNKERY